MENRTRARLRRAAFVLGGAGTGLAYFVLFGCAGSCAITASPARTMVYFALIGGLVSAVFAGDREG